MPIHEPHVSDEPFDRLTEISSKMIEHFEEAIDHRPDDKVIVFVEDDDRTGLAISGYSCIHEIASSLIAHLQAILAADGRRMDLLTVDDDGNATLVSTNHPPTNKRETN